MATVREEIQAKIDALKADVTAIETDAATKMDEKKAQIATWEGHIATWGQHLELDFEAAKAHFIGFVHAVFGGPEAPTDPVETPPAA